MTTEQMPNAGHARWVDVGVEASVPRRRTIVGLLALAEDRAVDAEVRGFLASEDVDVQSSRVGMPVSLTLDGFREMETAFSRGASFLSRRCHVVAVGCASAAVALGPDRLIQLVEAALPGVRVVEPIGAYLASLANRSAERIGLMTPYREETNRALTHLFQERGIEVAVGLRLRTPPGAVPSDVSPASIVDAVHRADLSGVEALVISCTALRTAGLLTELEAQLGIPVVTTNRALADALLHSLAESREG